MQDTKNRHLSNIRTTLSGYIFATKAHIDNRKKLIKQQCLSHMSSQYGERRPTNGWDRFGSLGHVGDTIDRRVALSQPISSVLRGASTLGYRRYYIYYDLCRTLRCHLWSLHGTSWYSVTETERWWRRMCVDLVAALHQKLLSLPPKQLAVCFIYA